MKLNIFLLFTFLLGVRGSQHFRWETEIENEHYSPPITRNSAEDIYRLPTDVIPLEYDIDIDLNFNATTDRAAYSYTGVADIRIQAESENISEIILHANIDEIRSVNVYLGNSNVGNSLVNSFTTEPLYHFLRISLNENMVVGVNYTLVIEYASTMNEGPLKRGIWRGHYTDANGNVRTYATTHFQPYNARQAFPCWDEPFFKAVFRLNLTRPADFGQVFTNTRVESSEVLSNGRVKDTFESTPKMSSYLVTFLVSESFQVIAEDTSFDPPIRIIARSNANGLGDKALEFAVKMTEHYDQYLGIPYSSLHGNLLNDHVSSPDWASAGTENWGMVSYRELYMILSANETLMSIEHYAATLVSHEIIHSWFGNLITCHWWSNTWINEGFASFFGYMGTYEMFPEYEHHDHFNTRYLQTSLSTDSAVSSSALEHQVNTPAQVTGHFGTISYSKGAAFLRMIQDMITPETFRKACNYFLTANAFEPVYPYHLLDAFERAIAEDGTLSEYQNFNFSDYYYTWVENPGYPLLNVDINYETGEMTLSQERFFISPTATPTDDIYPIPITYSTQSNPLFDNLKPTYMMTSQRAVLNKPVGEEWVVFNNLQHGHYRVNYDERTWELIGDALDDNLASFHYLTRGQIVDDVFALMRSEKMTYNFGLRILRFLRLETNFHVLEPAITGFNWITHRFRNSTSQKMEFDVYVLNQLEYAFETLLYDVREGETPTTSMARQVLMHFICNLGNPICISAYSRRFQRMKNGEWIDPRIRRMVYVNGIREGNEEDFEFLLSRYRSSNFANDQLEMLRGLGATRDPELLMRYFELTLTDEVRTQDKSNAFLYGLLGTSEGPRVGLRFVQNNIEQIRATYQEDAPNNPVHTVMSNLAGYLDHEGLNEYEAWLRETQVGTLQYATAISAIASSRTGLEWGALNVENILQTTSETDDSSKPIISVALMSALLAVVFYM